MRYCAKRPRSESSWRARHGTACCRVPVGLRRVRPLTGGGGFSPADGGVEGTCFTVTMLRVGRSFCQIAIIAPVPGTSDAHRFSVLAVLGNLLPRAFPQSIPHPCPCGSVPVGLSGEAPRLPFARPGHGKLPPLPGLYPAPEAYCGFPAPPGLSEAAVAEFQTSRPAAFPLPAAPAASTAVSTGSARGVSPLSRPRALPPSLPAGLPRLRAAGRGAARPGRPPGRRAQVRRAGGRESGPRLSCLRPGRLPGPAEGKPAGASWGARAWFPQRAPGGSARPPRQRRGSWLPAALRPAEPGVDGGCQPSRGPTVPLPALGLPFYRALLSVWNTRVDGCQPPVAQPAPQQKPVLELSAHSSAGYPPTVPLTQVP